jgi:hypothetical protein
MLFVCALMLPCSPALGKGSGGGGGPATPIAITQVSNLEFGTLFTGDPSGVIAAGTSETATNASFLVTGEASTAYTITLPNWINMTTPGGSGTTFKIKVDNFTSYPAEGANGQLDGSGQQSVYVGATRAAIATNQVSGAYSGSFTVEVVY